jgi:HSP20 family molecular chaperone IbpA
MSQKPTPQTPAPQSAAPADDDRALLPAVDVIEDAQGITLHADLPGVSKERLAVDIEGDTLTIAGDIALELPADLQASYAEVEVRRYRRAFTLSRELDTAHVSAEMANGVLRLRIPKLAHAQPRRIEVRAG